MFIDVTQFPFTTVLEQEWQAILAEYLALPDDSFQPWVQREMYDGGWGVYGLIAFSKRIEPALRSCPQTARLLEQIPGLTTAGFSKLAAGAHIQPHIGWVRTVYRAHLGLVTPEHCAIRVGSEVRPWQAGKCLIFDDTEEHEAWNRSAQNRIVLLFDFLRPGCEHAALDEPPPEVQAFVRDYK